MKKKHIKKQHTYAELAIFFAIGLITAATLFICTKTTKDNQATSERTLKNETAIVIYEDNTTDKKLLSTTANILQCGDTVKFSPIYSNGTTIIEKNRSEVLILINSEPTKTVRRNKNETFQIPDFEKMLTFTTDKTAYAIEQDPNCKNSNGIIIYTNEYTYYTTEDNVNFNQW